MSETISSSDKFMKRDSELLAERMKAQALQLVAADHPALHQACPDITPICGDFEHLRPVAARMHQIITNKKTIGIGIAAPQVGSDARMFVLDLHEPYDRRRFRSATVCINPVILSVVNDSVEDEEGCLTIPGKLFYVERPSRILAQWSGLDGKPHTRMLEGIEARAYQHELDHLNGVTIWSGHNREKAA